MRKSKMTYFMKVLCRYLTPLLALRYNMQPNRRIISLTRTN